MDGVTSFPPELADRYRRSGYWRGDTMGDILQPWLADGAGRVALAWPGGSLTYHELDRWADRLAAGFAHLGVSPGDRVVLQLPNRPSFAAVSLALFRLGAMPIYALTNHRHAEIGYLVELAEAVAYVIPDVHDGFDFRALAAQVSQPGGPLRHVVVDGDGGGLPTLADLERDPIELAGPSPSEVALFLLSGGTTGRPKLIPRTHDDYCYQLRATAAALDVGPNSVYLASLPAAHNAAYGCPGVMGTLAAGGKVALPSSLAPDACLPLIAAEGVTFTTLMPPLALLWLELAPSYGADLSTVLLQVGGAPMSPHNAERLVRELGCRFSHWFGMAEGLLSYTRLDDPLEVAYATVGRPLCSDDEVLVVDSSGAPVGPGAVGELLTRGPYTIRGYYRADEDNARAFTDDGFLRTGDLVHLTPEGNMVVSGRVKDVIIRGGEKVPAEEVEHHLSRLGGIREVAVVGIPDEMMGEKTCAVLICNGEPPTLVQLRQHLRDCGLADYKMPDRVVTVEQLPRTRIGKIDKAALRATVAAARPARR